MYPRNHVEPIGGPIVWWSEESRLLITHDKMVCDICLRESGEGNEEFGQVFTATWFKTYCEFCFDMMTKHYDCIEGIRSRRITYRGHLVSYVVDESGVKVQIRPNGRACKCDTAKEMSNQPGICARCYGELPAP